MRCIYETIRGSGERQICNRTIFEVIVVDGGKSTGEAEDRISHVLQGGENGTNRIRARSHRAYEHDGATRSWIGSILGASSPREGNA